MKKIVLLFVLLLGIIAVFGCEKEVIKESGLTAKDEILLKIKESQSNLKTLQGELVITSDVSNEDEAAQFMIDFEKAQSEVHVNNKVNTKDLIYILKDNISIVADYLTKEYSEMKLRENISLEGDVFLLSMTSHIIDYELNDTKLWEISDDEGFLGRTCYKITLNKNATSAGVAFSDKQTFIIDKETGIVLNWEIFNNENSVANMGYKQIKINEPITFGDYEKIKDTYKSVEELTYFKHIPKK